MYIFIKGHGSVRGPESMLFVEEGQSIIFKPGEAHQLLNTSENEPM
jgi:mannose-6-phosphate isomerase-like protein (cupin superfamily)